MANEINGSNPRHHYGPCYLSDLVRRPGQSIRNSGRESRSPSPIVGTRGSSHGADRYPSFNCFRVEQSKAGLQAVMRRRLTTTSTRTVPLRGPAGYPER